MKPKSSLTKTQARIGLALETAASPLTPETLTTMQYPRHEYYQ